jgi:hypothetical protein
VPRRAALPEARDAALPEAQDAALRHARPVRPGALQVPDGPPVRAARLVPDGLLALLHGVLLPRDSRQALRREHAVPRVPEPVRRFAQH